MQRHPDNTFVQKRRKLALSGEQAALVFLQQNGYRLVAKNWRSGRFAEIDLIVCDKNGLLVFAEVKTRRQIPNQKGIVCAGFDAVNWHKQRKIVAAACCYMARNGVSEQSCRFDVLVVWYPAFDTDSQEPPLIKHIRGAF